MLWKCSICGFLHEGESAPEKCRKCGGSKDKFYALTNEDSKKIYALDHTNDIYMAIIKLSMEINELAKEGIEINLDPNCAELFKKLHEDAWDMKIKCKNELKSHMDKGNW